jgi:hypothetical protein
MKFRVFNCLLLGCLPLQAQVQEVIPEASATPLAESPEASRVAPSIIGPLAGEPRPAPLRPATPPPPILQIPEENTLTSQTYDCGDHTVTIQEVIPVALPPRPAPPALATDTQRLAARQFLATQSKHESSCLSATVYDQHATRIEWRSKDNTRSLQAWSNIDFNYLRGITQIQQGDTRRYYFYFGIGTVDTTWMASRFARFKRPYQKPVIPELPASPETNPVFVITKGEPTADDLESLQALHDLYKAEHLRLKAAFEYQQRKNKEQAAELLAHQPKAPDLTLKHWTASNQVTLPVAAKGGAQ